MLISEIFEKERRCVYRLGLVVSKGMQFGKDIVYSLTEASNARLNWE